MKLYKMNKISLFNLAALVLLLLYFIMIFYKIIIIDNWMSMYIPIILTVVFCYLTFKNNKFILSLGANSMFLIYTIFSLLSLLILLPFFPNIENIRSSASMSFLNYPELIPAICISCIGIILFTFFTSVFSCQDVTNLERKSIFGKGIADLKDRDNPIADKICNFSIIILLITFGYFLFFSVSNLDYFSNGYIYRRAVTNTDSLFSYFIVIMSLSIVMFFTTSSKTKLKYGIVIFALLSLIQLLLGNRGEVFYPILASIAIYRKRGGTFKKRHFYISIFIVLIIIPLIRIVRNIGVMSFDFDSFFKEFSILDSVAESFGEMGFQIGTIVYMLRYLTLGGFFQHGATFVYSFHYFLYTKFSFIPPVDLTSPASVKAIMPTNYFAFTNIGEAYFNF